MAIVTKIKVPVPQTGWGLLLCGTGAELALDTFI